MILTLKGGKIRPTDIRDLRGVLSTQQGTVLGGFISLQNPTGPMKSAAAEAGTWTYEEHEFPKVQILTIREIVEDKRFFKMPTKVGTKGSKNQLALGLK